MRIRSLLGLALASCTLFACTHNEQQAVEPVRGHVGAAGQRGEAPLQVITPRDDFFNEATRYVGNEVTITAPVARVLADHAIELRHGGFMGIAAKDILVINESGQAWDQLTKGELVSIRGIARNFDRAVLEQRLKIDLDPAEFDRFQGEPYIAATAFESHQR